MTSSSLNSRTTRIWIGVLIALALLSFLAMRRSISKAMRMEVQTTVDASTPPLKVGEQAKAVLELTKIVGDVSLEGNVLAKESETEYRRTSNTLKIAFGATTPVVMGKMSDVHSGAIVHVSAEVQEDRVLHAKQIVILTGYITVR